MKYKKRNGFALIYTVLIGALVLISIVGLTIRVIPENAITKARTHSQRALSVAEAGASQVLFDLRNFGTDEEHPNEFNPDSGEVHYLRVVYIKALIESDVGDIFEFGESLPQSESNDSFKTIYNAKIKVTGKDEENKTLDVELSVLGTVSDKTNVNVLARNAIKTSFQVGYDIQEHTEQIETKTWVPGTPSAIFDYALYSGSDIKFNGSAQTVTGDIHAVGTIDLGNAKNQVRVDGGGDAEAEKNIIGNGIVTGATTFPASAVPFPKIDIDAYKNLADAFRSGTIPYDGLTPNFPNTSNPIVLSVIQSYLGGPGTVNPDGTINLTSSTLSGINAFYHDLMSGTGAFVTLNPITQLAPLQTFAKSIVYYVEGPVHINGQFECIGTLVVDGDLVINGNSQVGDPNDPGAAAILVKGDIDMANGTADLYGLFYSTGILTGRGTFYCEGSIAIKGSVDLGIDLSGNYTVEYHEITNPNLSVSTPGHEDITYTPGETTYYYLITSAAGYGSAGADVNATYLWEEVSFDDFEGLH
jgi:cytoskeletal protein CcmA (bactofilin family)